MTATHLCCIRFSTSSFNCSLVISWPDPVRPGLSLRVLVVALRLCSAALHCLGAAGNLCFKGVQALQEKSYLQGYVQVVVLRYRLELGLVLSNRMNVFRSSIFDSAGADRISTSDA